VHLKFYHLKKEPFNITPDPEFLFLSKDTREALASLIYGVESRRGFIVITAEVGVGKTTLLRSYLKRADKAYLKTVYIFNSNITFRELLKTIFQELDVPAGTDGVFEMVNHLHHWLIEEHGQGNNVVLIVDEAQNMPKETLENLRMLSNLETATDKLIQIVLVGQPELEQILNSRELRQLRQRIAIRSRIPPLTEKESLAYIKYRLEKVAVRNSPVFTRGAREQIVRKAEGIPRVLNVLCSNALITGFGYKKRPVNTRIAREVIEDFEGEEGEERRPRLRYVFAFASVFFVTTGLFWFFPPTYSFSDLGKMISRIARDKLTQNREGNALAIPFADLGKMVSRIVRDSPDQQNKETALQIEEDRNLRVQRNVEPMGREERFPSSEKLFPMIRAAKEGDSLYELTREVYGFTDRRLIAWIEENNPNIKNVEKLPAGELILFPGRDQANLLASSQRGDHR